MLGSGAGRKFREEVSDEQEKAHARPRSGSRRRTLSSRMKYCDSGDEFYKTYRKGRELAPDVLQMWMAEVASMMDPAGV